MACGAQKKHIRPSEPPWRQRIDALKYPRFCTPFVQEFVQMGSVTKSGKGWRAQVRIVGLPAQYRSFEKKTQAWEWAAQTERDLRARRRGNYPRHTVQEALEAFLRDAAPRHKGYRWEAIRIAQFLRYEVSQRVLTEVGDDDMALWREARLKQVSAASVRREMVLWGQVFEYAREQLRWVPKNVMRDVRKPSPTKANPKDVPQAQIDAMVKALGKAHKSREVALGFLLGCETAMRPWEMLSITKDEIHWRECFIHLEKTKNGDERDVPLSPGAIEVLVELDGMNTGERLFSVAEGSVTALWAQARKSVGILGLHFRHSRRVGVRRLSKRLALLDLARAVGHRDLNSLRHYYYESASEMAKKLAHPAMPSPSPPSSAGERHPKISQEAER